MEFKDQLRKLRKERGITQKELAEKIYISRSAVAKWENGLGIPNSASYSSLLDYFGITSEEFPLNEEKESAAVAKNRKRHIIFSIASWILLLAMAVCPLLLVHAIMHGYGFTSEMAIGEIWADNERIRTKEYDFYYYTIDTPEGEPVFIGDFSVCEKKLIGYQKIYPEAKKVYTDSGENFGIIYSLKGKVCYYHFFKSSKIMYYDKPGVYMNLFDTVTLEEQIINVLYSSYFVTESEISEFYAGETHCIIK